MLSTKNLQNEGNSMWWSRHNRFHKVIKHIEIQNVQEYLETFELKIT